MSASLSATVLPLVASMESILGAVEQNVLDDTLGKVISAATSLAAVCVCITLIGVGSKFLKGKQFDWWQFVRPLLVFFIVMNFSTIVLGPVRGISGYYGVRLAESLGGSVDSFKELFRERAEAMCSEEFGSNEDTWEVDEGSDNWFVRTAKKVGNKITHSFFKINEKMNLSSAVIVSGLFYFFLNISVSVMVIIARIYLVVMALIGPFTFAVSILTTYSGGIKLWVERYIQYTLWQPGLYIVLRVGTEILIQGNQPAAFGAFWAWCFMCIAIFTAIKQVPAFASFIIESMGTESLANQMSGIGGQLLQKASSAAMIIR